MFFVDRDLGRGTAKAIAEAGYQVIPHDDEFDASMDDQKWLPIVGERGWVVLSRDKNIRNNVAELQALIHANVHAFFVNVRRPTGAKQTAAFLAAMPHILEIIKRRDPPSIGIVNANGQVKELEGYDQLVKRMENREQQLRNSRPRND